ncbi:hypothetical protein [Actinomadura rugatobispora]|uniref:DMT family transporter n=1 Tax=Actinomadura rugatobispora TaxID=1994 RepID=A0ABW1ABD9_9ACTN|nr:hypothetical protein GCM10010200_092150 [Actinomadura rugatobispora]
MTPEDWPAVCAAFASSGVYFAGIALLKVAADRVRPPDVPSLTRLAVRLLTTRLSIAGAVVMAVGLILQWNALSALPLPIAQPVFVSSLAMLPAISLLCFTEHPSGRELLALALVAGATAMTAAATADIPLSGHPPSPRLLTVIVAPCLMLPIALFVIYETGPVGRHARPSTGVVFGLTAGVLIGTAEVALNAMTRLPFSAADLLGTPYPYLFVIAAGLGVSQLQVALRRHRMLVVVLVATVVAKTHLLLTGTLLHKETWPAGTATALLLAGGIAVLAAAIAVLPRYEAAAPERSGSGAVNPEAGPESEPVPAWARGTDGRLRPADRRHRGR